MWQGKRKRSGDRERRDVEWEGKDREKYRRQGRKKSSKGMGKTVRR